MGTTTMLNNRIEPWTRPVSNDPLSHFMDRETNGTQVVYGGTTLRAHGEYSDEIAASLLASLRHMDAEGIRL